MKVKYLLLLLIITGCSSKKEEPDNIVYEVAIEEAMAKNEGIVLSDFVEGDVEYIPLETKKESLLNHISQIYSTDTFIIAVSLRQMYLFSRNTGKFIREIGHFGKDPGGFYGTEFNSFDESRNIIFAEGWEPGSFYEYNIEGKLRAKILCPVEERTVTAKAIFNDTSFVFYSANYSGSEEVKLTIFNVKNEKTISFPNYLSFPPSRSLSFWGNAGWFYRYNNGLNFFELFTDTVFQVTEERLLPRFVLKMGEYAPPYEKQNTKEFKSHTDEYFFVKNIYETKRYLLYKIEFKKLIYYGLYDKTKNKAKVSQNQDGYINDIDNFIPLRYTYANSEGELIGYQDAYWVRKWFDENPEKAAKLPPHLQELRNMAENDNPVVMIAKLKE